MQVPLNFILIDTSALMFLYVTYSYLIFFELVVFPIFTGHRFFLGWVMWIFGICEDVGILCKIYLNKEIHIFGLI